MSRPTRARSVTLRCRTRHGDRVRGDADVDGQRSQRGGPVGGGSTRRRWIGRDAGGSGSLPHRQLDGQLVAGDERHLEQPEQEHHHQRQGERQLDGGLSVGSLGTAGQIRSVTASITRSKSRPILAAPPPAVAHATTSSATSAAASRTRAYSVVA